MREGMATWLARRRRTIDPISTRGRAAALTTGAVLFIGGAITVWASWAELTCNVGGRGGRAQCRTTVGVGGMFVMFGLAAAIGGAIALWRAFLRPLDDDGSDGWVAGEVVLVVVSLAAMAIVGIDLWSCPSGYDLARSFAVCIDPADPGSRIDPSSHLVDKLLVAGAALPLGAFVWWRRVPWLVTSVVTIGVSAWALVVVIGQSVRFPA